MNSKTFDDKHYLPDIVNTLLSIDVFVNSLFYFRLGDMRYFACFFHLREQTWSIDRDYCFFFQYYEGGFNM